MRYQLTFEPSRAETTLSSGLIRRTRRYISRPLETVNITASALASITARPGCRSRMAFIGSGSVRTTSTTSSSANSYPTLEPPALDAFRMRGTPGARPAAGSMSWS